MKAPLRNESTISIGNMFADILFANLLSVSVEANACISVSALRPAVTCRRLMYTAETRVLSVIVRPLFRVRLANVALRHSARVSRTANGEAIRRRARHKRYIKIR